MVITRKLEDGIYMIMIPDEGVKTEIQKLSEQTNIDTFIIGLIDHYKNMDNYYEYIINSVTEYLTKNQKINYYKLLDVNYFIDVDNYVQCYTIKANKYDAELISKKVSKLINNKKVLYERNH